MAPKTNPITMGDKSHPLPVAEAPFTTWKNSGANRMIPYIPNPRNSKTTAEATTARFR